MANPAGGVGLSMNIFTLTPNIYIFLCKAQLDACEEYQ